MIGALVGCVKIIYVPAVSTRDTWITSPSKATLLILRSNTTLFLFSLLLARE